MHPRSTERLEPVIFLTIILTPVRVGKSSTPIYLCKWIIRQVLGGHEGIQRGTIVGPTLMCPVMGPQDLQITVPVSVGIVPSPYWQKHQNRLGDLEDEYEN